jgi:hypothetical protein
VRLRLKRREILLLTLVAVAALVWLWQPFGQDGEATTVRTRARPEAPTAPVPRIALARIDEPPADVEIGRRDLFAFGAPQRGQVAERPPTPPPAPAPSGAPATTSRIPRASPERAGLPPMNLRFIGLVGNEEGVQVAVLVTERNEVLTGRPGDLVANRYRIERIGIESVDLQDVGTGESRRVPLKGN